MEETITISKNELIRWFEKLVSKKGNQLYYHFKGKVVLKQMESICSEDGHTNYLYQEIEIDKGLITLGNTLWSRPMSMFLENIPFRGIPRFKPVTPIEAAELLYPEILKYNNPQ